MAQKLALLEILENPELVDGMARTMDYDNSEQAKGLTKKQFCRRMITQQVFSSALQGLALLKADQAAKVEIQAQQQKYTV